ncbi:TNF receptor-associated factor 3 [Stylophora pistillata]|uniref:TNF receptor-associated factor 3 n=1 Tax=Stylophora pistillata TaxID=50429 RepID=A0A2B4SEG2_STYPI|nr:TNF receptor-associated factor 3 [Stylophora pistillata]
MSKAKVKFLKRLDKKLLCPLCQDVLKQPWQTSCGHQFCFECLQSLLSAASPSCPIDGNKVTRDSSFHDKCCEREVLDLQCFCQYKTRGCDWRGELRQLQAHGESCEYVDVLCRECKNIIERRLLEDHRVNQCINRASRCLHCGAEVIYSVLKDHFETCLKFPMDCVLSCGKGDIPRDCMEDHLTAECPNSEVPCHFTPHGCKFKGKRDELQRHVATSFKSHLEMLNQSSFEHKAGGQELEEKLARLQSKLRGLGQLICHQNEQLTVTNTTLQKQQTKISSVEREIFEQKEDLDKLLRDVKLVENAKGVIASLHMDGILETLREHELKITQLKSELSRLSSKISNSYEPQRVHDLASEHRLERAEQQLSSQETQLSEQSRLIENLETTSYDGVYIWKIDHYNRRFQEAVSERRTSIYSSPFYLGRFGYKVICPSQPKGRWHM